MQRTLVGMAAVVLSLGVNVFAQQGIQTVPRAPQVTAPGLHRQGGDPGRAPARTNSELKLSPIKTIFPITNPQASQSDGAIIAVLMKQKQAAEIEASQMAKIGTTSSGTTPMTAGGTLNRTGTVPAGTLQKAPTVGTLQPGRTMAGGTALGSMERSPGNLAANQSAALLCGQDSTMRILKVSGDFHPATFTQDDRYNFYTITGCSFGNPGPNAKVYIYYKDMFRQDFQIKEWNENGIKLSLNPMLRGVKDQDNLTLVVQRNDGKQATKDGYKFYAARENTLLTLFPQRAFSLDRFTPTNTSDLKVQYSSPSSQTVAPNIKGYTTGVSWNCTDCFYNRDHPTFSKYASGGTDIYEFKDLQPGFVAYQAAMASADLQCPSGDVHREGNFGLKWSQGQLWASWQGQTCTTLGCGGFGQPDCFISPAGTNYAVNIWVQGPRGVDPWSGKPR